MRSPRERSSPGELRTLLIVACPFPCRRGTPARPLAQLGAFERIGIEAQVVTDHLGTGWVVPNDDARGFAEAVVALLRDRCLRHRLGRAGRRTVRGKYAGADPDRRLRGVYETVLAFERRPPEVCLQRPARDATGTIRRAGVVGRG